MSALALRYNLGAGGVSLKLCLVQMKSHTKMDKNEIVEFFKGSQSVGWQLPVLVQISCESGGTWITPTRVKTHVGLPITVVHGCVRS